MEKTPTFRVQPFGDYFLLQRIAVGGMAEIFKANQIGVRGFEKIVVIKKILQHLSEDPEFVEMFEDEAKIAAQLTQANVVQIYELGEVDGTLYITMEYIDGKNLRDTTRAASQRGIHLSIEQTVHLMCEVLKGLDYAHRKTDSSGVPLAIVHRDMSPQNIIISYEGEVKILDFGIAKAASKISKTEAGVLKGKFSYMSPEQASGKIINQTSDIYACGVILHELLTSERLFRSKTDMETLERVKEGKVLPPSDRNPDVPPELDRIVLKALSKDLITRYQTASEMLTDLNRFSHDQKFSHSSQELSAFMKTLFAETIALEKERLLRSLAQIPSAPQEDGLQNARTHIAFKRAGFGKKGKNNDESDWNTKSEGTITLHKGLNSSKARMLLLLSVICLMAAAGFLHFGSKKQPEKKVSLAEQIGDLLEETPKTRPLPDSELESLKASENSDATKGLDNALGGLDPAPAPVPTREVAQPKPEPKKVVAPEAKKPTPPTPQPASVKKVAPREVVVKKEKPAPAPKPVAKPKEEKKKAPAPPTQVAMKEKKPTEPKKKAAPLGSGKVDVIAPPEGFAQLLIDGQSHGTVPGPKARGIALTEGSHEVECQTSSKVYSGKIELKADERITVRCQELTNKD